jgi:maleylacetoacetate isomerase
MLKLYSYWRSSAAYRARIALNVKGLAYEYVAVNLVRDGGEQHRPGYRSINPQGLVPALVHDGVTIAQSLAIIEYLDETFPGPRLLPGDAAQRALARQIAYAVACEIHPLNNTRVQQYLVTEFGADDGRKKEWMHHWMRRGFDALQALLQGRGAGPYTLGDQVTVADCCIVPQLYNARRFGLDTKPWPLLVSIETACNALPAFRRAHPDQQPDAPT